MIFFGMASGAFAAAVPQGCTQGTRPAWSSAMTFPGLVQIGSAIRIQDVLAMFSFGDNHH